MMERKLTLGLLVMVLALGVSAQASLLLHYGFDEGTGTSAASSVNATAGNTLELAGAAGWGTGITGGALEITSASGVADAVDPTTWVMPTASSDLSLALWVNLSGGGDSAPRLAGAISDSANGYAHHYQIRTRAGSQRTWGFLRDDGKANTIQTAESTGPAIVKGVWTHLAITFDASEKTLKIYENGVLHETVVGAGWNGWGSATNVVKAGVGAAGYSISGLYDEIYLYDEALDGTAIGALAAVPEPATMVLLGLGGLVSLRRRK